jgi:hypothetical protein
MRTKWTHLLVVGLLLECAVVGEEVKRPRFGIYMPKLDVYTATPDVQDRVAAYLRTTKPGEIPLAGHPIVSEDDIVSYDWETHTLHLKRSVWFTIRQPGVYGVPFVVVVDGVPCYVGAFWSAVSSIPSHVPCIIWDHERKSKDITIQKAYPTAKSGQGDDPRSNEQLKNVLQELGKLRTS